jgi:dephospho-CoA kinase|tara:strand:+ start:734 stop:1294 length:561 start_codon:yes stop_codon:yes gene_type:complete
MITIGITGSISSGKSTVAKIIAKKKYPLFSADKVVADLYKSDRFIKLLVKKFNINNKKNIKKQIKTLIKKNENKLKTLEDIIHPLVRKKMNIFLKIKNKILVLEIPLLIESKLNKCFDRIIFVDAKKKIRLKRFLTTGNNKNTFEILNKRQISPIKKKFLCDFIIKNNYSLAILKKNVKKIVGIYE